MKKQYLVFTFILTFVFLNVDAQYSVYRHKYDYKNYTYMPGDPYQPSGAGGASLLIPGLGQMICGEGARGTGFLLGCTASFGILVAGVTMDYDERDPDFEQKMRTSKALILTGLTGSAIFWIWSITDAVKVAKVKNMAFRDKRIIQESMNIYPYIKYPTPLTNNKVPIGLSLNINF